LFARLKTFHRKLSAQAFISLASAFVITAEFDPLRDEGEAYAARLREGGVHVKVVRYDGMIHDFVNIAELRQSRVAVGEAAAELRKAFAT
jgi:acetyl esterase